MIPRYPSILVKTALVAASAESLPAEVARALLRIALRAKAAIRATTASHRRLTTPRVRRTTEPVSVAATPRVLPKAPALTTVSPKTAPAVTHHRRRAASSAAASTKSLPAIVTRPRRKITFRTKPAIRATTASHRRLATPRARRTTKPASSTAAPGIALKAPARRTVSPETAPAATHHGARAACSAAASTKSPPTIVTRPLRRITLRSKPAIQAAISTHLRLATPRARRATEPVSPAKVARTSLRTTFTIAALRQRRLDGFVAEFGSPSLHHAPAYLL
ncbi:MAG: hypothetical protein ACLQU3_00935 [Limisphaerales bacterium]